jgi:hypothetical protein
MAGSGVLSTRILTCTLALVAPASSDSAAAAERLELTLLPDGVATAAGARCLDSSPAGYYAAAGADASKWIVYLQGGGECETRSDCVRVALAQHATAAHTPRCCLC